MDANRFNQILFVDSLPVGESNMARRLVEDIQTYAVAYAPSPEIKYVRAANSDELIQCISEARHRAGEEGVLPMLHLECHGSENGFMLADGSIADWMELKHPITELNVATGLNLMIAVAACTGGALATVIRMSDRAPFWGLIGPTETLYARELDAAFRAFYSTLLSTKSTGEAINDLDKSSKPGLFWRSTSQALFEKGWAGYKREYCSPEALERRATQMQAQVIERSIQPIPSIDELKARLISHEPAAFERFRHTFFMCDLYPEHAARFPIKYAP